MDKKFSKQEIFDKLIEMFPGSFMYNDGKECRINLNEDGAAVQIKVALTAAKTPVEPDGSAVSEAAAESFLAARDLGMTWPQILNAQYIPASIYGFDVIPQRILFGPDGTILKRDIRSEDLEEVLAEVLK